MTKAIMNYTDRLFEEALEEENETKGIGKAAMSGAIEGFIDSACVFGTIWIVSSLITIVTKGKVNVMRFLIK